MSKKEGFEVDLETLVYEDDKLIVICYEGDRDNPILELTRDAACVLQNNLEIAVSVLSEGE